MMACCPKLVELFVALTFDCVTPLNSGCFVARAVVTQGCMATVSDPQVSSSTELLVTFRSVFAVPLKLRKLWAND